MIGGGYKVDEEQGDFRLVLFRGKSMITEFHIESNWSDLDLAIFTTGIGETLWSLLNSERVVVDFGGGTELNWTRLAEKKAEGK
jgi:hypothetical protein